MPEVTIATPRGVRLAGTFEPPTGTPGTAPPGGAVLFAHGFLADRSSRGRADVIGAAYRRAGWATLAFDFSGCGESDDDVVTVAHEVEDLTAAGEVLAEAGYRRQVVHGHSLGALVALRTASPHVEAMVLTGAVTGPIRQPWEDILSTDQIEELRRTGRTTVVDDGPSSRTHTVISTETIADFTDVDQAALLVALACPVLLVHGGDLVDGEEHPLLTRSRVGLTSLPAGSRLEVVRGGDHALLEHSDHVARTALAWLAEQVQP